METFDLRIEWNTSIKSARVVSLPQYAIYRDGQFVVSRVGSCSVTAFIEWVEIFGRR